MFGHSNNPGQKIPPLTKRVKKRWSKHRANIWQWGCSKPSFLTPQPLLFQSPELSQTHDDSQHLGGNFYVPHSVLSSLYDYMIISFKSHNCPVTGTIIPTILQTMRLKHKEVEWSSRECWSWDLIACHSQTHCQRDYWLPNGWVPWQMDFIETLCHQMNRVEKYKFMSTKLGLQRSVWFVTTTE